MGFVLACVFGMRMNAEWVEKWYSLGWYRSVRRVLSGFSGSFGFSVAELVAALVLGFLLVGVACKLLRSGQGFWKRILGAGWLLARTGLVLVAVYLLLWGGNQYRLSLQDRMGWHGVAVEGYQESLLPLAQSVAAALVRDAAEVVQGGDAGFGVLREDGRLQARYSAELERFSGTLADFGGERPAVRAFGGPGLWARFGIGGIYVPFTGEPHFLGSGPAVRWPFRALHEIAHQRGYAREDEANFFAWWIGHESLDAHIRYSANLVAWTYLGRALRRVDREEWKRLEQSFPQIVTSHRRALRAFWKSFDGPAKKVGGVTNNVFLKLQGQTHGVRSYDRMLGIMLRQHRAQSQSD